MSDSFTLSSGYTVQFRGGYTVGMERAYMQEISRGTQIKQVNGQVVVENIRVDAEDRATEILLGMLIARITKDGQEVPYSTDWLLGLPQRDFKALRRCVEELRADNEEAKEAGKKNR